MSAAIAVDAASAPQGLHQRAAEEAFQPIIIQPDPQAMADQPLRHGVEHAPEKEPTAARHCDQRFLKVIGAPRRQRRELWPLDLQRFAASGIGTADDLVDEAAIGVEIGKVSTAP